MTPEQMLQQAVPLLQAGRLAEAEALYQQILVLAPMAYPVLHLMGLMRLQQGRMPEALALLERALRVNPGAPETLANQAIALSALGRQDEAVAALDKALAAQPGNARLWSNRGGIKSRLGRNADALKDLDRALALEPRNFEALNNRGLVLHALGRYAEALASFDATLAAAPDYLEARNNSGLALREMARDAEALSDFDQVIARQPDHAGAHVNRAGILWRMERLDAALESYDRALAIDPDLTAALESRANLLWTRKQALAPAIADWQRAVARDPDLPYAQGNLLHLKMHAGDWRDFDAAKARLDADVRAGRPVIEPFAYQGLSDSLADGLACAVAYAARKFPPKSPVTRPAVRRPGRIRVGYVSGEFRAQATLYLAAGLFEQHDRARFEVFAFDSGRDDQSAWRARALAAFETFIPISALSDAQAAGRIAEEEIDILVNLNGYFGRHRMGVFAYRPAPIQVNYLGFPGTLGADYMDYILADAVIAPPEDQAFYREKIVVLPGSYQINDDRRAPVAMSSRAEQGLPQDAFVFCHFNYGYKITPGLFAAWMRILKAIDSAVLWLLSGDPLFAANLAAEAARQGVNPQRLIFAPPLERDAHLARLPLGDLFLDSLISNAHTTASDALWAGLPLLTCRGATFQGRVAASLLTAVGLPELIAENLADYESLAIRLAREPQILKNFRQRLEENRRSAPLFDTARTTRAIEAAYEKMMAGAGEAPQGFAVP
jgi:predicted O-linked N-acetylglucosamine transferase (SPINDLY family)